MNVVGFETLAIGLDEEATNLVVFVFHLGPYHGNVGDRTGGDPHLLAVQHVLIADFPGARAHAAGVRTEARLGQSKAAELFTLLHRG